MAAAFHPCCPISPGGAEWEEVDPGMPRPPGFQAGCKRAGGYNRGEEGRPAESNATTPAIPWGIPVGLPACLRQCNRCAYEQP